jgi:hypothetical protein
MSDSSCPSLLVSHLLHSFANRMDPSAGKRDRDELQQDENNESKRSKIGFGTDPDPAKRAGDEVPSDEQRDAKRSKTDTAASTDHGQPPVTHAAVSGAVKHAGEPSAVDHDHDMPDQHHERRHSHEGSGRPDRVWYNDENTVFVKGLPSDTTEEHLTEFFQPCGTIVGVRLGRTAEGHLKVSRCDFPLRDFLPMPQCPWMLVGSRLCSSDTTGTRLRYRRIG